MGQVGIGVKVGIIVGVIVVAVICYCKYKKLSVSKSRHLNQTRDEDQPPTESRLFLLNRLDSHFKMSEFVMEVEERAKSIVSSWVSMKSDMSKEKPLHFGIGPQGSPSKMDEDRAESTVPSWVSLKSDRSKGRPLNFGIRPQGSPLKMDEDRAGSTVFSCVSLKSDRSRDVIIDFRSSEKIERGEHILSNWDQSAPPGESSCSQSGSRSGDAEMKPKQRSDLQEVIEGHKISLKRRCEHVTEELMKQEVEPC
ncbi:uncharacterized protein LOC130520597 isoform X1 [Takifugu flavidus]|uniref:uncharacterized protein LOC130520597 isoform X1 n=1 Tax=Takifugu flavidus TaxID=433684 RepID=UPI0025449D71|nr:uncharacterized protein LOC130520597 isoform X1 [Takifugu flavidus]XP_056880272.1 uncharacterized protein LOC130520597 isoform X1 [Takifugu flavidus]